MKKVILTLVAVMALGVAATASVVYNQTTSVQIEQQLGLDDQSQLPQAVKVAVERDYPGCNIKEVSLDQATKYYTLVILEKEAKETTKVIYKETGEKVVDTEKK